MSSRSQIRSLGRFLYTQNPFYLISCFLILYGLQIATYAGGDLYSRSIFMSGSIGVYTLLMALTCVGVVRLCRVWQDARSIFLVVIIGIVALSSALDELSISSWNAAATLLAGGALFSIIVTEFILRACRLRFPSWYRLSFYALLGVFFGMPILLGHAVAERLIDLTNWGAVLFSTLCGLGLLLLVPAVRQGAKLVAENGTPWHWPLYPLTVFVILVVLAAIRSHAIWMSFGFIGAPVRFEPFLLMPIALAILVLVVESEHNLESNLRSQVTLWIAPALLLCGLSRGGMTSLPIHGDLQLLVGSAWSASMLALLAFYVYLSVRRVPGAANATTVTLLLLCVASDLPNAAATVGLGRWVYALLASLQRLLICLRDRGNEREWVGFTMVTTFTIATAGVHYDRLLIGAIAAVVFADAAMMTIGAVFRGRLATRLRQIAAGTLIAAALLVVGWDVMESPGVATISVVAALMLVSIVYLQIVRRTGWLYVIAVQTLCLATLLGLGEYEAGTLSQTNWPFQSGLLCFVIGLTITSFKTGVHHRFRRRMPRCRYRRGF